MSLLIKKCKLLQNNKIVIKNILIENGKINKISNKNFKSNKIINAKNNFVIPGLIDSHVHFREPGLTHKEDFLTGSRAAAAGGITTVLDMPNTKPPTLTVRLLAEKRELAKKSVVNYGFHFGSSIDNLDEIKKAKNTASVKVFMNASTGNMLITDDKILKDVFSNSKINTLHAEKEMVNKAIGINRLINNKIHFLHISSKSEIEYLQKIKNNNITVEVTPHHLFLNKNIIRELGGFAEMKPSLKLRADQAALWNALNNNMIDTIATDHAPHTKEEKLSENKPYGVPGCETMLPLLLDAVNKNRLTLKKAVELTSRNPAKIFGIKNKGILAEGYDADLTIIDMKKQKIVKDEDLFTKCGWSPFNGFKLKGWLITTIVNGNVVFDDGNINDIKANEVEFG